MTLERGSLFSMFFFFAQAILLIYQFLNYFFLLVFRMFNTRLGQWLNLLVCSLMLLRADAIPVGITYVENAVAKGAGNANSDCSLIFLFSNFPRSYSSLPSYFNHTLLFQQSAWTEAHQLTTFLRDLVLESTIGWFRLRSVSFPGGHTNFLIRLY